MVLSSGISGFDAILNGGLRAGHTMLVTGGPGCGKTMLGMQFLAAQHEPGLMLSFEESPEKLVANAATLTFPFAQMANQTIHFIDGRPPADTIVSGKFDLQGLLWALQSMVAERRIKHIVVDAIDALFALSEDKSRVRSETLRLLDWLNDAGMTAIITMKANAGSGSFLDEFDFAEYVVDGVLRLKTAMHDKLVQRTMQIIKRRGAPFVGGEHPYTIGAHGIRAMSSPVRTVFAEPENTGRCSSGVERLDRMLKGGFLRGTTTLFSGLPGSSKTTFGAAFLNCGCAAGERALFIGFDEPAEQMVRNVRSVGIDLASQIATGLLRVESFAAGASIADDFFLMIEDIVAQHKPERIVVDPISALLKAGGAEIAESMIERLVIFLKGQGVSALFTTVSESTANAIESTPTRVSTVADTWIHLSFAAQGGERNRTLTIVKSRGTGHSPQTREVVLGGDGITLADVYSSEGAVLFGSARLEHEQNVRAARFEESRTITRELQAIDEEKDTLALRAHQVSQQIALLEQRRGELEGHAKAVTDAATSAAAAVQTYRRADPQAQPVGDATS